MGTPNQRFKNTRYWPFVVHDASLVAERVLGCLLSTSHVSNLRIYLDAQQLSLCREGVASAKRYARWGMAIIPVTYVSCFLVAFLKCIPFEKQWQIDPEPQSMS